MLKVFIKLGVSTLICLILYVVYRNAFQQELVVQQIKDALQVIYQQEALNLGFNKSMSQYIPIYNFFQIRSNSNFCMTRDLQRILHPDVVLYDTYVFSLREHDTDAARGVIKNKYFDTLPFAQAGSAKQSPYNLKSNWPVLKHTITEIYQDQLDYAKYLCIFDKGLRLPNVIEKLSKSNVSLSQDNLLNELISQNKSDKCLKQATFTKKSYVQQQYDSLYSQRLNNKTQCEEIFKIINQQEEYIPGSPFKYLVKDNNHQSKGVDFLNPQKSEELRKKFQDGELCGTVKQGAIIQEYIYNPIQFDRRKVEVRIYVVVVSTNPWIQYYYLTALAVQCLGRFSFEKPIEEGHFCNLANARRYYGDSKSYIGDDAVPLAEMNMDWPFEEINKFLIKGGYTNSTTWYKDVFMPTLEQKLVFFFQSTLRNKLIRDSRLGRYFGIDVNIDEDLNIWLLDCNHHPSFKPSTPVGWVVQTRLHTDAIELLMVYIRVKYMRIRNFVITILIPRLKSNDYHKLISQVNDVLKDQVLNNGKIINNFKLLDFESVYENCI